jgi:hypothetical protein
LFAWARISKSDEDVTQPEEQDDRSENPATQRQTSQGRHYDSAAQQGADRCETAGAGASCAEPAENQPDKSQGQGGYPVEPAQQREESHCEKNSGQESESDSD